MIPTNVKRPRNVDWKRAAAILYGDWGTSKAYVIGLAFAVAGYSSFWLIAAMCVLTALVGINYTIICRLYRMAVAFMPVFAIAVKSSQSSAHSYSLQITW